MRLEHAVPQELDQARKNNVPLIIPVGVIEYHSSHLPVGTDALVAEAFTRRLAEKTDVVVAPTFWYGPASYAVMGPEHYSIDMDSQVFCDMMRHLFMALLRAGWRRICVVIAHQTEDFNPTETACLHAARTALFKYLEETRGMGWWGKPESQTFYQTLKQADNPWNWIKIYPMTLRNSQFPGDHAGKHETSMMMSLCPDLVRTEQIGSNNGDWFTQSAVEASREYGEDRVNALIDLWLEELMANKETSG